MWKVIKIKKATLKTEKGTLQASEICKQIQYQTDMSPDIFIGKDIPELAHLGE